MGYILAFFFISTILLKWIEFDTLRWIWFVPLFLLGSFIVLAHFIWAVTWCYNLWIRKKTGASGTMIPLVGGVSLSLSVLAIPINLPMDRLGLAVIALFSDLSMIMLILLPFYIIIDWFKKE